MEEEPLHLQPFVALLGNLLANASSSASSRKKSTAIPASLRAACTHCDRSTVSQQLLYEATGVNWSVERQSITPPGSESPTSLRLASFGCCISFTSVWQSGAQMSFQFQRVFATPQQALAYFLDPQVVAWESEMANGPFMVEVSERCAWARSLAEGSNGPPASATILSNNNRPASGNTDTPAFRCRVFRSTETWGKLQPELYRKLRKDMGATSKEEEGLPAEMSNVCALVVRGAVFVKLFLSVCSGKNGNAEESIMRQLVHFVVRALPPEHMAEVALFSDAV